MTKRNTKRNSSKFFLVLILAVLLLNGVLLYVFGKRGTKRYTAAGRVPPYFITATAAQPLPPTLEPSQFSNKDVAMAYEAAKQIPEVLAQQPCYCYCDRWGHRSLLDCFVTKHGADCDICVKEALFAMQEHRNGKSPEQIRVEVMQGAWKSFQLQSS